MTRDKKTYIGIMVAVLIAVAIIILLDEINLPLPESDKGLHWMLELPLVK
jgi:hypothetical protein